jgi:hypothetical protein
MAGIRSILEGLGGLYPGFRASRMHERKKGREDMKKSIAVFSVLVISFVGAGCGSGETGRDSGVDGGVDAAWDEGDAPFEPAEEPSVDLPLFEPADVEEEACVATEVQASNAYAPVDIIWAVDSSSSMDYENRMVQDNLNRFSASISAADIDHHVVLIGEASQMNVPPPLGGSEYFMHIDDKVDSNEGLVKLVEHYPDYRDFLREGAVRHFVVVSDDNSEDMSADEFIAAVGGFTDPGFPDGFTFHSIVAFGSIPYIGCATGARIGHEYLDLSGRTGGVVQSICQTDWSPIFDALETAIAVVTELPCVYDIPPPPEGEELEPGKVNVVYTAGDGTVTTIPMVPDAGSCGPLGWYYDDPEYPARIIVCPDTCTLLQSDTAGKVNIAFGCTTVVI